MAKAKKAAKKSTEPKEVKGFVKMYSPMKLEEGGAKLIFGHKAESMKNGHTVVYVPEECFENEQKRGNALMTQKVYDVLYPAEETSKEE